MGAYAQQLREEHRARQARLYGTKQPNVAAPRIVKAVSAQPVPKAVLIFPTLHAAWNGPLVATTWRLDIAPRPKRRPSVRDIMEVVGRDFSASVDEICGHSRILEVLRARMVTMYLARRLTLKSSIQIARIIGDRDHTTVLNAVKRIKAAMIADPDLAKRISRLEAQLSQ